MFDRPPQRRDNGLRADAFVALADVDPRLGEHLLDLLRLSEIAAYLEPPGDPRLASRYRVDGPIERLFVQSDLRGAAREVVLAAAREAGAVPDARFDPSPGDQNEPDPIGADAARSGGARAPASGSAEPDLLAGMDTDAEFARIMAGFDRTASPRRGATALPAERPSRSADRRRSDAGQADAGLSDPALGGSTSGDTGLGESRLDESGVAESGLGDSTLDPDGTRTSAPGQDAPTAGSRATDNRPADRHAPGPVPAVGADDVEDDEDEHFVPPPAPPFPVPRANTVGAVAVLIFGLLVIGRGYWFGLGGSASFPLGVVLVLTAVGLFVRGLRESPEDPDPDDGAIV